jgi:hypothetical protein
MKELRGSTSAQLTGWCGIAFVGVALDGVYEFGREPLYGRQQ